MAENKIGKIRLKRGLQKDLPKLDVGEPGFTTDTKKLFIGGTEDNVRIPSAEEMYGEIGAVHNRITGENEGIHGRIDQVTDLTNEVRDDLFDEIYGKNKVYEKMIENKAAVQKVNEQLADQAKEAIERKRALNYYWHPESQPPARTDEPNFFMDAFTKTADEYIANHFEPMRNADPNYVKRRSLGKDQSNTYDIWEYTFSPVNYKKTVIISSCLHGGEVTLLGAMIRFLHYLMNEWEKYPNLAYIRENVRIIYVPIANPWGVSQKPRKRQNSNGVDLNRNFDYKWGEFPAGQPFDHDYKGTSPFSEKETQIIRSLVQSYPDAIAHLDLHNTGTTDRDYFVYLPEAYPHQTYEKLVAYFTKGMNNPVVLLNRNSSPTLSNYLFNVKGIPSSHPEWCDIRFGTRQYNATEMTKAVEWISNVIMEHCREFNANAKVKSMNVTNVVQNSDYSSGTTGWSRYGMGTMSVSNKVLSASGTTGNLTPSFVGALTQTNVQAGTKIFAKVKFMCPPNCTKVELKLRDFTSNINEVITLVNNPQSGAFIELKGNYQFSQTSAAPSIQIVYTFTKVEDVTGAVFQVKEALVLNFSNDFSNYAPSSEELSFVFSQLGDWFTGSKETLFIENSGSLEKNQKDLTMYLINRLLTIEKSIGK